MWDTRNKCRGIISDANIRRNAYIISRKNSRFRQDISPIFNRGHNISKKTNSQINTQKFVNNNEQFLLITRDFPNNRMLGSSIQRIRD